MLYRLSRCASIRISNSRPFQLQERVGHPISFSVRRKIKGGAPGMRACDLSCPTLRQRRPKGWATRVFLRCGHEEKTQVYAKAISQQLRFSSTDWRPTFPGQNSNNSSPNTRIYQRCDQGGGNEGRPTCRMNSAQDHSQQRQRERWSGQPRMIRVRVGGTYKQNNLSDAEPYDEEDEYSRIS